MTRPPDRFVICSIANTAEQCVSCRPPPSVTRVHPSLFLPSSPRDETWRAANTNYGSGRKNRGGGLHEAGMRPCPWQPPLSPFRINVAALFSSRDWSFSKKFSQISRVSFTLGTRRRNEGPLDAFFRERHCMLKERVTPLSSIPVMEFLQRVG